MLCKLIIYASDLPLCRFASGVTLLCSEAKLAEEIKKCYVKVKSSKQMCEEYLAVTVGVPCKPQTSGIAALALQESKFSGIKQASSFSLMYINPLSISTNIYIHY